MSREILKGSGIVSILNIVSRLFGLVWNLLMARVFGAGILTDIFFVAFRIPNMLRSFLGEGALTSAFVPVFAEELIKSKEQAARTLRSVIGLLIIGSSALTVLGIWFSPLIISLTAPGLASNPQSFETAVLLTRIVLPYIIFVSVIATINGALNNLKFYGAAPLAQISMNIVLIIACFFCFNFDQKAGIIILSLSVLVGGLVQILVMLPHLKKSGLSIIPKGPLLTPVTKRILYLMIPALFGAAIYQISIFLNTLLASLLETGSISWLFYADRVSQIPIGIVTVSIASVLLPALSGLAASGEQGKLQHDLSNTLRFINFLIIPCATLIFCLAEPIVRIFFERGSFEEYDTFKTVQAIQATAFGLWGVSVYTILNKAFLARKDTRTPAQLGLLTLILNFFFSLILMGGLKADNLNLTGRIIKSIQDFLYSFFPIFDLGHAGLAFSSGLAMTITMLISYVILNRKHGAPQLNLLIPSFIKALFPSILMILAIFYIYSICNNSVLRLISGFISGITVFIITAILIKSNEMAETFKIILRLKNKLIPRNFR